jgi:hypothetical protein
MHRIVLALVALISLVSANVRPAEGQNGAPVGPTRAPQQLDASPDHGAAESAEAGAIVIGTGETRENVVVRDGALVVSGSVSHDVVAINSSVTLKRGAHVGGTVDAIGSHVTNDSGETVRVFHQDSGLAPLLIGAAPEAREVIRYVPVTRHTAQTEDHWAQGQFGLFMLGLLGGLILLVGAPRATDHVAETIERRSGRCLVAGIGCFLGMLILMLVNSQILRIPLLGSLWSPIGALLAILVGTILAFGWLAGMRFAGDALAHRWGRSTTQGGLYGRILLGLGTFFLANLILGGMNRTLGIASVSVEFAVALMGVGAMFLGGFGKDAGWLSGFRGRG